TLVPIRFYGHDYYPRSKVYFFLLTLLSRHFNAFFFFSDTPTTEIYTLSLHDALPIFLLSAGVNDLRAQGTAFAFQGRLSDNGSRSEEHTSELQSRGHLVCRLLLEKKKIPSIPHNHTFATASSR